MDALRSSAQACARSGRARPARRLIAIGRAPRSWRTASPHRGAADARGRAARRILAPTATWSRYEPCADRARRVADARDARAARAPTRAQRPRCVRPPRRPCPSTTSPSTSLAYRQPLAVGRMAVVLVSEADRVLDAGRAPRARASRIRSRPRARGTTRPTTRRWSPRRQPRRALDGRGARARRPGVRASAWLVLSARGLHASTGGRRLALRGASASLPTRAGGRWAHVPMVLMWRRSRRVRRGPPAVGDPNVHVVVVMDERHDDPGAARAGCRCGPSKSLTAPAAGSDRRGPAPARDRPARPRRTVRQRARSRRGYMTSASRPFWCESWPSPP